MFVSSIDTIKNNKGIVLSHLQCLMLELYRSNQNQGKAVASKKINLFGREC